MPSAALLVDTNVIGELARPRPNPGVARWAEGVSQLAVSVVTVEEVFYGLAWRPNARVRAWFEGFLASHAEVLGISGEIARRAGELRGRLKAEGVARSQADMLIAATAEAHRRTLVTRNVRDFESLPVTVLDPFS